MNAVIAYFMTMFDRFEDRAKGATAVEYGLLVAVIALVMVVGAAAFGTQLSALFQRVATTLSTY